MILEIRTPEGGKRQEDEKESTEKTTVKGARASFPSGAADIDRFYFSNFPPA